MKNKILIALSILCLALGVSILGYKYLGTTKDSRLFKKQYENLNGKTRESDPGNIYPKVKVSPRNPISYVTMEEAVKKMKSSKVIVYFGYPDCPWCRNVANVLIATAKEEKIQEILYVDMEGKRDLYELKEHKLVKTKEAEKAYYDLLDLFKDVISDYVLEENGNTYSTGEKRMYVPLVAAVDHGKVLDSHTGTVELDQNQTKYDGLTKKQKEELSSIYKKLFNTLNSKVCRDDTC